MSRVTVAWFAGATALVILGFVVASSFQTAGTIMVVAGIVGLFGFLLYVWWVATTTNDQWVWQTPHKPRREHLAEKAAKHEQGTTGTPPDAPDPTA